MTIEKKAIATVSVGDVLVMGAEGHRITVKAMRERPLGVMELDVEGHGFTRMSMSMAAVVRVEAP